MTDRAPGLPPLTALRAAEAAARTGSIAAAAAELGVTPAAVSQQIRHLEDHLGRRLFARGRHGVTPTAAGRAVMPYLAEGFASLARVAAIEPDARAPGIVSISASASVAFKWLPRVVAEAQAAEPSLRLEMRIEEDPVRFGEDGPDLRVTYGELPYSGLVRETLVHDVLVPLAAPGSAARADRPGDIIHTDWGPAYASPPSWADWARRAGVEPPDTRRGHHAAAPAVSMDMAAAGMGVTLANALLARSDLANGRLAVPFGPAVPLPAPYMLYYRDRRPRLAALAAHLRAVAERDLAAVDAAVP